MARGCLAAPLRDVLPGRRVVSWHIFMVLLVVLASAIQQKAAYLGAMGAVLREHLSNNGMEQQPMEDDVGGVFLGVDDMESESDEEV
jgi:hypothetical protein